MSYRSDGNSYGNWKNTSRWSHTHIWRLEGFWSPDSIWRMNKLRLGSSSVPWRRRYGLALLGYSSLPTVTPLLVFPTKPTAAGHPAGSSGSFPLAPRSPQPAVSTNADSDTHRVCSLTGPLPTCSPNSLADSLLHWTHWNIGGFPETRGSIPQYLSAKIALDKNGMVGGKSSRVWVSNGASGRPCRATPHRVPSQWSLPFLAGHCGSISFNTHTKLPVPQASYQCNM